MTQSDEPVHICVPFMARFREPLLNGTKIYTSRTKAIGQPGDTFQAFGGVFHIIDIEQVPLAQVAELWKEEGCNSREDFIALWNKIHPRRRYREADIVYLHKVGRL